ncbi:MAG: hypothetical protein KF760_12005 [Candidatus Eremiobacteraeota bacterium]|nr:hypothetical protein [Candidatus Eremiobacteraeota bacterium]MCW5868519.1 hypothetical protein [Candidatus Eremiobacteraeota bacterium]
MGRKKKSGSEQPTARVAPGKKGAPPSASQSAEKKVGASPQIILAMGVAGALLGFLSGLNLWPPIPQNLNSLIASSGWLAGVLGQQHLDYHHAVEGLFLGLSVGLGSAYSFNLPMRKMVMTWLLAGGGLLAGALIIKSAPAAALGWVIGLVAAQATPA